MSEDRIAELRRAMDDNSKLQLGVFRHAPPGGPHDAKRLEQLRQQGKKQCEEWRRLEDEREHQGTITSEIIVEETAEATKPKPVARAKQRCKEWRAAMPAKALLGLVSLSCLPMAIMFMMKFGVGPDRQGNEMHFPVAVLIVLTIGWVVSIFAIVPPQLRVHGSLNERDATWAFGLAALGGIIMVAELAAMAVWFTGTTSSLCEAGALMCGGGTVFPFLGWLASKMLP